MRHTDVKSVLHLNRGKQCTLLTANSLHDITCKNDPGPISTDDWCTCVTNFTVSLWLCVMFVMTRVCSLSSAIISTWAGNLQLPLSAASYHKWDYIKIKMSGNLIIRHKTLALPNLPCPNELKCGSFHKRVNDVQVISAGENIMRIVVPVALHAPPRVLVAVIHHCCATNHFCICAALWVSGRPQ